MAEQIITKTCSHCKEIKPLSEFYKSRNRKDGHHNQCKTCSKKAQKAYQSTDKYKAKQKRYFQSEKGKAAIKRYYQSEKGKILLGRFRKSKKGKATIKRYSQSKKGKQAVRKFHALNPEKIKAKNAVRQAIKTGKLPSAKTLACYNCEKPATKYHHWHGYEPEHFLDVIPLCGKCHYFYDRHKVIM